VKIPEDIRCRENKEGRRSRRFLRLFFLSSSCHSLQSFKYVLCVCACACWWSKMSLTTNDNVAKLIETNLYI